MGTGEMAAASSCTLLVCVRKISDRHAEKLKPQGILAQAASGGRPMGMLHLKDGAEGFFIATRFGLNQPLLQEAER